MRAMDVGKEELTAVFNIMDEDQSGEVDYSEFVDQLYKMRSNDQHTMLVFIKHYVSDVRLKVTEELEFVKTHIQQVGEDVGALKQELSNHGKLVATLQGPSEN